MIKISFVLLFLYLIHLSFEYIIEKEVNDKKEIIFFLL